MRKSDLAKRLAREAGITKAEAADQLDRAVHQIVTNLRKGQVAELPGLGHFTPGQKWQFAFDETGTHDKPPTKK